MNRPLVLTAAEAAALDRRTVGAGTPSRALMQRAGAAAAGEIMRRFASRLSYGVAVHGGPGNNGGDAWVVASALARHGVAVRWALHGADAPTTDDARFEHARAVASGVRDVPLGSEGVVVDGVLGIGARGAPPSFAVDAVRRMRAARDAGSVVVALDLPTGVDATTGATYGDGSLVADLTLTFGVVKRGLLVARAHAGTIAVLDVGFDDDVSADAPRLVGARDLTRGAPLLAASAHKGTRGKIAIIGGASGMAGAPLLAAEAALRSGAGMTRVVVAPESLVVAQCVLPESLAAAWPSTDEALSVQVLEWADVVLLGPGLGSEPDARSLCERVLATWRGPIVLDADAITLFSGEVERLASLLAGRGALLTPHPLELSRLAGVPLDEALARRFEIGREIARRLGATVLLKGVPTIVSDADARLVSASGTPALAVAGSGDVLGGIAATLLAHGPAARSVIEQAALAAWVHGRAGEIATSRRGGARGTTLRDVLDALSDAWRTEDAARPPYPVLCELPAVQV